jgi:parallel beta-helix repeat protein
MYTNVWNNYVYKCTFQDSPSYAIGTNYYTYIDTSWFYFNVNPSYAGTSAVITWAASPAPQPTNLQFTDATVQNSGLGATSINGTLSVLVQSDHFYGNHHTCFANSSGSQVGVVNTNGFIAKNTVINNNIINGENVRCSNGYITGGMELYGLDYQITGNIVYDHLGSGIDMDVSSGNTISSNQIYSNAYGISLWGNRDGEFTCAPQTSPMYTIENNVVTNNTDYWLWVQADGCADGPFPSNVTLTNNTTSGNGNNNQADWLP